MKALITQFRIAVGLTALAVCVLLTAMNCKLLPDETAARLNGQRLFSETIATTISVIAPSIDAKGLESTLLTLSKKHNDVQSIIVRRVDGSVMASTSTDTNIPSPRSLTRSADSEHRIPITVDREPWGILEVHYSNIRPSTFFDFITQPNVVLLMFVTFVCLGTFFVYLPQAIEFLDPHRAVPARVRDALNALAGGLMILNQKGEIVLSNNALASTLGIHPKDLVGRAANQLPWRYEETACGEAAELSKTKCELPWESVAITGQPLTGVILKLAPQGTDERTFMTNVVPIRDEHQNCHGILISLEDITPLEQKKTELSLALSTLRDFNNKISEQNRELERLATRDALTGCLNRRAFFDQFSTHWENSDRYHMPLATIMVDVDHFKSINDRFGHSTGDLVLQRIAAALMETARQGDIICRYGGEEFAILLPFTDLQNAKNAAERIRLVIAELKFESLNVTVSVGVSETSLGATSMQDLLDQADKCLYLAKRTGRNRIVSWDALPSNIPLDALVTNREKPIESSVPPTSIPYPAVTALISALAYRDVKTAEHSRRVADSCVMVAEGLMSKSECYVLEIAALLHDIGKIGVPDEVLLKPGTLTREEWRVMEKHDRIGVEIIRASFNSLPLSAIVENHHAYFGGGSRHSGLPNGKDIPLGARLLAIADAFDAMVSDRVYRKGRSPEEAFAELRRCAGTQFDPELVERFIANMAFRMVQDHIPTSTVSKDVALNFGLQMERIAAAIDSQDMEGLKALASRLNEIATKCEATSIADKARKLEQQVGHADLISILNMANELQSVCRATQNSYFTHASL